MVRLQRSMTCFPAAHARVTSSRQRGCSSGAPPVISTVGMAVPSTISSTRSITASGIDSVRSGPASTWQWRQVWLHFRPTFTCRISIAVGRSG